MSVFLSIKARMRWGKECRDYRIAALATTGQMARKLAVQLKVQWGIIPSWMKKTSTAYVICSFLSCCVAFFTLVAIINALKKMDDFLDTDIFGENTSSGAQQHSLNVF